MTLCRSESQSFISDVGTIWDPRTVHPIKDWMYDGYRQFNRLKGLIRRWQAREGLSFTELQARHGSSVVIQRYLEAKLRFKSARQAEFHRLSMVLSLKRSFPDHSMVGHTCLACSIDSDEKIIFPRYEPIPLQDNLVDELASCLNDTRVRLVKQDEIISSKDEKISFLTKELIKKDEIISSLKSKVTLESSQEGREVKALRGILEESSKTIKSLKQELKVMGDIAAKRAMLPSSEKIPARPAPSTRIPEIWHQEYLDAYSGYLNWLSKNNSTESEKKFLAKLNFLQKRLDDNCVERSKTVNVIYNYKDMHDITAAHLATLRVAGMNRNPYFQVISDILSTFK